MINQSLFPDGWQQQSLPDERAAPLRLGVERLGVNFITMEHGVAQQDVYRGKDNDETVSAYWDRVGDYSWFHSNDDETEWYIPSDFNYESKWADNYRFGCQTHLPSEVESCQLAGQYDVYLIRFRADMSPVMTYSDLDHILQAIDSKMVQCLSRDS